MMPTEEALLIKELQESLWNNKRLMTYINSVIKTYELGFDINDPPTEAQQDLVTLYQVQILHRLLGKVIGGL